MKTTIEGQECIVTKEHQRLLELDKEFIQSKNNNKKASKIYLQMKRYSRIPSMNQKIKKLKNQLNKIIDNELKNQLPERRELVQRIENMNYNEQTYDNI